MNIDSETAANAADAGPRKKPALLRIKRRRGEAATDEIIVATAQPRTDPKRLRMDQMLLQMSGFGISHSMAPAAPEPQKRQRFRRVKTVDLVAFNDKTAIEMELMVATWSTDARSAGGAAPGAAVTPAPTDKAPAEAQGAEGAMPPGIVLPGEEAAAGPGPASPLHRTPPKTAAQGPANARQMKEALRDMAMQRSSTARYMQVRAKRQQQQEQQQQQQGAESAFQILDLVCTDVDESGSAERAERKRQAQEQSKKAAADGVILMNYMPMVHQFLEEHGLPLPPGDKERELEAAGTAAGEEGPCAGADAGAGAGGGDVEMPAAAAAGPEADSDVEQEFVYDVYVPVTEADGDSWAGEADPEGVPVVEVEDREDPFYEDAGSLHDSEDSNAESYYANSYPDEDEAGSDEDEDEEGWCHVAQRGEADAQRSGDRWDDEEYDLTKDVDPDCTFVPHVPDDPDAEPGSTAGPGAGAGRADLLFFLKASRAQAAAQKQGRGREQGDWGVRIR